MTNTEFVCHCLRRVGRAEAAQILEQYSDKEWQHYSSGNIRCQEFSPLSSPQRILDVMFNWCHTPQGDDFWQGAFADLLDFYGDEEEEEEDMA